MSDFINSVILTTNTHPYALGLTILIAAFFLTYAILVVSLTGDHYEYDYEDNSPIFITEETRPLLESQDPLKDYPRGKYITRSVSAKRARKQSARRALLRQMLEADWVESSYGTNLAGPRVGEKRKMRNESVERVKRVRVEGSSEGDDDSQW